MPHKRAREHGLCVHYTLYHIYYSYQWSYRHIIYPNYDTRCLPRTCTTPRPGHVHLYARRSTAQFAAPAAATGSGARGSAIACSHSPKSCAADACSASSPQKRAALNVADARSTHQKSGASVNSDAQRRHQRRTSDGLRWWNGMTRVRPLERAIKHTRRCMGRHASRCEGAGTSVRMQAGRRTMPNRRAQPRSKYSSSRRYEDINFEILKPAIAWMTPEVEADEHSGSGSRVRAAADTAVYESTSKSQRVRENHARCLAPAAKW